MIPHFSPVDIIALLLLLISGAIGVARGLTREVLGVLGWIGAATVAFFGSATMTPYVSLYIKHPLLAQLVGGATLFTIALVLLTLLNRSLSGYIKGSALGGIDRSLGLLFGLGRAGALIVAALFCVSLLWKPAKWPDSLRSAHATKYAASGILWLHRWLPSSLVKRFEEEAMKETLANFTQKVTTEALLENLSQPQPSAQKDEKPRPKSPPTGYQKEQIEELDKLLEEM